MFYRLGIDIGETSIGWFILQLDKKLEICDIVDGGVYIFPDGREAKSREPLSVSRRTARGIRRNLDRKNNRKRRLIRLLEETGIWPDGIAEQKKLEALDPFVLRQKAVNEKISLPELGRVLFHLNQRRGFKSNRKSDGKESESGKIKLAVQALETQLAEQGCRTYGEYLCRRHEKRISTKVRPMADSKGYEFYPTREMAEHEFDLIMSRQQQYHPELTSEITESLRDVIFFQRSLRPQAVGKCELEPQENRAPVWHPLFQRFRILQEVNNLDLVKSTPDEIGLTAEQKKKILLMLQEGTGLNKQGLLLFTKIKSKLNIPTKRKFNLQSDKRTGLQGDWAAWKLSDDNCLGKGWFKMSPDRQVELLELLHNAEDDGKLKQDLIDLFGLNEEQAENVAKLNLPEGYASLSLKAIKNILLYLEQGKVYSEACTLAGYNHTDRRTGEIYDYLPYYGRILKSAVIGGRFEGEEPDVDEDIGLQEVYFGKINNPTVHVGLNQLRKVVNEIISRYGKPQQVVVELARELKLGVEGVRKLEKRQKENQKDNEKIAEELERAGQPNTYQNRMMYKIWERLAENPSQRCCPFSGRPISVSDLFSGAFEIEHLIPFSRSFDDSINNKVISSRDANRFKAERTPYEAFGNSPGNYKWEEIVARSENLPREMQWRFSADAMEKFAEEDGCLARMLTDTQYFARCALQYLEAICENQSKDRKMAWGIPGQLTAMLRDKWGLNSLINPADRKDRSDHRHHAVDAFVVACTSRSLLKKMADAARLYEKTDEGEYKQIREKREKLIENMPLPFENFDREKLQQWVNGLVIAFKPDHGVQGQLHRDTCYGYIEKGSNKGSSVFAVRKDLRAVVEGSAKDGNKKINEIADVAIRSKLLDLLQNVEDKKQRQQLTEEFMAETGIRRVRCHIEKSDSVMIPVRDNGGQIYKYYESGNNSRADIYCATKGKDAGKWKCEIISTYSANQKDFVPEWRRRDPHAKLIMKLHINDMVAYDELNKGTGQTERVIARVKKMTSGLVFLRGHLIAKEEGDKLSWGASANQMQEKNLRKVYVDAMGKVKDPMFKNERKVS